MKSLYSNSAVSCSSEVSNRHADAQCDMTGTYLHCVDVLVLMAFRRAAPLPAPCLSHPVCFCVVFHFCHCALTPTCYPSIAPSASLLCFQRHFDSPSSFASAPFFFSPIYGNYLIFSTDLFYLNDLAVSFRQHFFCGGITRRRGKMGFAASSELL